MNDLRGSQIGLDRKKIFIRDYQVDKIRIDISEETEKKEGK